VAGFLPVDALTGNKVLIIALIGFLLFRVFDIVKPWPIRKLEKLPKGWGILADDLLAGVYGAIALSVGYRLFMAYSSAGELS
jgi:phosphatidylglycerophosphatase A